MLTEVVNLWSGARREFPLPPQDAVVTAYAQDHKDYNTHEYAAKYNKLVFVATVTVTCGSWCAYLDSRATPESRLAKIKEAVEKLGERGTIHGGTED